ncbi:MAG: diguanylate cyclase, partial [Deltaproteobacteria bacterium]|nr:diguanylate cyclase [Deltaproteobacteria bacterium]
HLIKENITMSIGVAAYPRPGLMNSGDLVNAADKALYAAKAAGKDCIRVDGREDDQSSSIS